MEIDMGQGHRESDAPAAGESDMWAVGGDDDGEARSAVRLFQVETKKCQKKNSL